MRSPYSSGEGEGRGQQLGWGKDQALLRHSRGNLSGLCPTHSQGTQEGVDAGRLSG